MKRMRYHRLVAPYVCPTCGAEQLEPCRTPLGYPSQTPHQARWRLAIKAHDEQKQKVTK